MLDIVNHDPKGTAEEHVLCPKEASNQRASYMVG